MAHLVLDEDVSKCCARGGALYTAERTVHIQGLGRRADDRDIHRYVLLASAILVTLNGKDYADLAVRMAPIPVIVLPKVEPRTQRFYLREVVPFAQAMFGRGHAMFVEVSASGDAYSYRVGPGFRWSRRPIASRAAKHRPVVH